MVKLGSEYLWLGQKVGSCTYGILKTKQSKHTHYVNLEVQEKELGRRWMHEAKARLGHPTGVGRSTVQEVELWQVMNRCSVLA